MQSVRLVSQNKPTTASSRRLFQSPAGQWAQAIRRDGNGSVEGAKEAAEGTIRKKYATSISENAVHGSDSDENAAIEGAFHFSGREQF